MARSLEEQVADLDTLSPTQLQRRWREVARCVIPRISPAMLKLALAYELQTSENGDLSRETRRRLSHLGAGGTPTRQVRAGMRFVREWNGTIHIVTVDESGVIHWNDRPWGSLSEVARAITGTRWSGPAFFGLKRKPAA